MSTARGRLAAKLFAGLVVLLLVVGMGPCLWRARRGSAIRRQLIREERDLEKIVEAEPHNVEAHARLGNLLLAHGAASSERAIRLLRRAIELDPDYGWAYKDLAAAYVFSGDVDMGMEWMKKAEPLFSKDTEKVLYYLDLGALCEHVGQFDKAVVA